MKRCINSKMAHVQIRYGMCMFICCKWCTVVHKWARSYGLIAIVHNDAHTHTHTCSATEFLSNVQLPNTITFAIVAVGVVIDVACNDGATWLTQIAFSLFPCFSCSLSRPRSIALFITENTQQHKIYKLHYTNNRKRHGYAILVSISMSIREYMRCYNSMMNTLLTTDYIAHTPLLHWNSDGNSSNSALRPCATHTHIHSLLMIFKCECNSSDGFSFSFLIFFFLCVSFSILSNNLLPMQLQLFVAMLTPISSVSHHQCQLFSTFLFRQWLLIYQTVVWYGSGCLLTTALAHSF